MGDMLVAYEDDVPKDRGLKVSGHCALDSGLGCANTFAPYCIYIYITAAKNIVPPLLLKCSTFPRRLGHGVF